MLFQVFWFFSPKRKRIITESVDFYNRLLLLRSLLLGHETYLQEPNIMGNFKSVIELYLDSIVLLNKVLCTSGIAKLF